MPYYMNPQNQHCTVLSVESNYFSPLTFCGLSEANTVNRYTVQNMILRVRVQRRSHSLTGPIDFDELLARWRLVAGMQARSIAVVVVVKRGNSDSQRFYFPRDNETRTRA
jgi:hypothetical protein